MSTISTCPKCGGKMKFSRVVDCGSFIDKRRDCPCGYATAYFCGKRLRRSSRSRKKRKLSAGVRHVPHKLKKPVTMKAEETHADC